MSHFNEEEYRVIRALFDPSNMLSDEQVSLFLSIAKETKLDPKRRQICAVPKYSKKTNRVELVVITQIDGLRLIAERTGNYAPGKETKFLYTEKGSLLGATSYVKKKTSDGQWHEVSATALLQEYDPGGSNYSPWSKMPHVMIEKCAEARALRRAFPQDLSGLYGDEEIAEKDEERAPQEKPVALTDHQTVETLNQYLEGKDELKKELLIDHQTVETVNKYLEGKDELKKELLDLCKVSKVEEIKESQREACKRFLKKRTEKEKDEA